MNTKYTIDNCPYCYSGTCFINEQDKDGVWHSKPVVCNHDGNYTLPVIDANKLPVGTHFWAKMDDHIVVIMKSDDEDTYYVCGGWECALRASDFEVIAVIPFPNGYRTQQLYYIRN
ncbi:MAG TPA: hypothetical protein VD794_08980 [Flavisolibacter sp.]|nr:hypothetical protein [Flavisolibacter sp.]